jgi:hypothetical protein
MLYSRLLALDLGANRRVIQQGAIRRPAASLRLFFSACLQSGAIIEDVLL